MGQGSTEIVVTGTLQNIRDYADQVFKQDRHQCKAFELIVAAFIVQLYKGPQILGKRQRTKTNVVKELKNVNHEGQFVGFLSGPGGTGKSRVINSVLRYCKTLCDNAGIGFSKRTITVTALTGAAAVNIFGETTHGACLLNARNVTAEKIEEWKDTKMLIVDEISFASKHILMKLNKHLNLLKEVGNEKRFGNIPVLFAGDFTQLEPVGAKPLYLCEDDDLFFQTVTTFMELKTNHRFTKDKEWGDMLARMRIEGASAIDLEKINKRVVCKSNHIKEEDIPHDSVYATSTNIDKTAINDGIFSKHLMASHHKHESLPPPKHTICIKASNLMFKSTKEKGYSDGSQFGKDIVHACCGEGQVKSETNKRHDMMLKLYMHRPLCINENIDVQNCIANGAMCKFIGLRLKEGAENCVETILIDGFLVNCVEACHVHSISVEMMDGNHDDNKPKVIELFSHNVTACVHYPLPFDGPITKQTKRIWRKMKFEQFPVNVANARTVHKLQGRSIKNIVVSNWDYTGNWVYVVLSRCSTLQGVFLRKPLNKFRPMSEKNITFHMKLREQKKPK